MIFNRSDGLSRALLFGLMLLWSGAARADQSKDAKEQATRLWKEGMGLYSQVQGVESPDKVVPLLEQAINRCREATELQPDFFAAHALWADCLLQLVKFRGAMQQPFEAELRDARERFTIAARCQGAIYSLYVDWADLLIFESEHVKHTPEQHRELLRAMQRVYEEGLPLTHFSHERGPLETVLANCLVLQAHATDVPAEKKELYAKAVARFETAATAQSQTRNPAMFARWGLALLDLSKLKDKDPDLLQQAIGRLEKAIELNPRDTVSRYNLACCYTLRQRPADAINQLQHCLDDDPQNWYVKTIPADPDFAPLHGIREYEALLSEPPASRDAAGLFNTAVKFNKLADEAGDAAAALKNYQQAADFYRQTVHAQPDFPAANGLWAQCLVKMANRSSVAVERRALLNMANERFAEAARGQDKNWSLYAVWGLMLGSDLSNLATTAAERRAFLEQAIHVLETGIELAALTGDRARLEKDVAISLSYLTDLAKDSTEKLQLSQRAISGFETAAKLKADIIDAKASGKWGVMLLNLARQDKDKTLLRQAIQRLQTSTDKDPTNAETNYNLACAYAMNSQAQAAVRHLRACFEHDRQFIFIEGAQKDADLKPLHGLPEYRALFEAQTRPLRPEAPPLSVR